MDYGRSYILIEFWKRWTVRDLYHSRVRPHKKQWIVLGHLLLPSSYFKEKDGVQEVLFLRWDIKGEELERLFITLSGCLSQVFTEDVDTEMSSIILEFRYSKRRWRVSAQLLFLSSDIPWRGAYLSPLSYSFQEGGRQWGANYRPWAEVFQEVMDRELPSITLEFRYYKKRWTVRCHLSNSSLGIPWWTVCAQLPF